MAAGLPTSGVRYSLVRIIPNVTTSEIQMQNAIGTMRLGFGRDSNIQVHVVSVSRRLFLVPDMPVRVHTPMYAYMYVMYAYYISVAI